ncbi:MAG: DegQ family serine endoprotease, partial [Alphaproteobacteria bacterium]|nr:DegQ family serine endoprotease [Alphaproteobacteria bacterium]
MRITHIALAMCLCCFICLHSTGKTAAQSANSADTLPPVTENHIIMVPASFADLAEKLSPSVVNISSTQKVVVPQDFLEMPQFPEGSPFEDFFKDFMERRSGRTSTVPTTSLGSGFIIDAENGYIITNNHVVLDAENVHVTFADDVTIDAKIIGIDEKTDIAVLQVDAKDMGLKAVPLGDSNQLRVGDWTLAIGNPFGLGGSVTAGIVSARARNIHSGPYDDYIQTDASINRGNSGGPLFNLKGEVIGINTAIFSPTGGSVGIGFSIPSALAKPVINQIIKYGRTRRGWLGVHIQSVTEDIAETLGLEHPTGALIASVNDQGPAKKGGLKSGDIILKINGQKIKEMRTLPRIIAEYDINSAAKIVYWRDGKKHTTTVTIGELEKAEDEGLIKTTAMPTQTSSSVTVEMMGFTLQPIDETVRNAYNLRADINGVLISDVTPMSEADKKGLRKGNIIVEI